MKSAALSGILASLLAVAPAHANTPEPHTAERQFFAAIDRGDVDAVLAMLHPSARQLTDAPVLHAWIDAINTRLGDHEQIQILTRDRQQRTTGTLEQTRAEVTFQRGTAESECSLLDGKIIAFSVTSSQMANWFEGPTTVDPYDEVAQAFIRKFLAGRAAPAHDLMHPALQQKISPDQLQTMIDAVTAKAGPLQRLTLQDHRFSTDGSAPALFLTYAVECEQATATCEMEFQFARMQGHLLGFRFQ